MAVVREAGVDSEANPATTTDSNVHACAYAALAHIAIDHALHAMLTRNLERGILLNADYNGYGGAEIAMRAHVRATHTKKKGAEQT